MLHHRLARFGSYRSALIVLGTLAAGASTACRSSAPPAPPPAAAVSADTWAVVDGRPITKDDVEKAYRRTRDAAQAVSDEEAMTTKLALLNDLILQDILLAKAAALKLDIPAADLDTAYANAKKNMPDDAYQQELNRRNLTVADMRDGLRREMLTQKVIEQEVGSRIAVSEQDVAAYFNANRAQFNLAEESYHIAQIVVTPVREQQIANASGDDAATPEAAAAKVRMLMERLKGGGSFRDLASAYSEDPETAPRGGDLGFVPVSRLKQAPPPLRDAVLNKQPGAVNVASANGAHTLVLVVAHEQAGQRDLSTPGLRERITETLRGRKDQLMRAAYLTVARGDATVVNHAAHRLLAAKPAAAPVAPLSAPGQK